MNTQYLDEISRILQQVRLTQLPQMEKAARMLADATLNGHNLFVFGCNHAGLLAMEMYYRTGGMVNINPVRGPGLHLEIVPATMTSQMERMDGYGCLLMDMTPIGKDDVIIIHSVSGRNAVSVDAAIRAREKGARVIALTNMETSAAVEKSCTRWLTLSLITAAAGATLPSPCPAFRQRWGPRPQSLARPC